jgi:glycosyltransferase involved in cell wall biosynthesis
LTDPRTSGALVTVVLAHRNCERLLGRAIASILAQTLADLSLAVVDDASDHPDRFVEVVRAHADLRMRAFRTSRNVGQFRIYNRMLPSITTPFIAFQDADDRSEPERLEALVEVITRGGCDVLGSHLAAEDEQGEHLRVIRPPEDVNRALAWRCRGGVLFGATTIARVEFLRALGGYDGTTRFGADSDLAYRAVFLGRVANLPRPLYRCTMRADSLMRSPETGDASAARRAYRRRIRRRFYGNRLGSWLGRLGPGALLAEPNDVEFDLVPVD